MERGGAGGGARNSGRAVLTPDSVQAVLEQLKPEPVGAHFDALELLDRDADAETLHEGKLCPHYATLSEKVTFGSSMRAGRPGQQQSPNDGEQLPRIEVVTV